MVLTASKLFRVDVSSDGMTALLARNSDSPCRGTPDQVLADLNALSIKVNPDLKKNIESFCSTLSTPGKLEPVVIARGTPPVADKNGKIEKLYSQDSEKTEPSAEDQPSSRQSHYDRSTILTASAGQPLLKIIPPVSGSDGCNVYGKSVPRKLGIEAKVTLGPNVELKGDTVFSTAAGRISYDSNKIWVSPKLDVPGNVDFSVGNIDFSGEIEIVKNVLDLFKVKSDSTITIHGMAEAAEIRAGIDLIVKGGIIGKEKGIFFAGRDIYSKYITNANVRAGQNIIVHSEIVNSTVVCKGRLEVEHGKLVGGHTTATGGILVKELGSDANIKTLVEVGVDEAIRQLCVSLEPEIKKRRQKAHKVMQTVEPLLQNKKYLNPEQREKATELLYTAEELKDQAEEMVGQIRKAYEESIGQATPDVEILEAVYPGVTIRFPRFQTLIKQALGGPLKIKPVRVEHEWIILAVDTKTNSKHELDLGINTDPLWSLLDEILELNKTKS